MIKFLIFLWLAIISYTNAKCQYTNKYQVRPIVVRIESTRILIYSFIDNNSNQCRSLCDSDQNCVSYGIVKNECEIFHTDINHTQFHQHYSHFTKENCNYGRGFVGRRLATNFNSSTNTIIIEVNEWTAKQITTLVIQILMYLLILFFSILIGYYTTKLSYYILGKSEAYGYITTSYTEEYYQS